MTRYTYATSLSWGGDEPTAEMEVEVSYTVTWGAPEQGPSYASGGQPADPDEIDDIRVETIDGRPLAEALKRGSGEYMAGETVRMIVDALEMDHYDAMLKAAAEADHPDPDYLRDQQLDDGPDERQEWADFDPDC